MTTATKRVLFFDTVVDTTDDKNQTITRKVPGDFWTKLLLRLEAITDVNRRIVKRNGRRHYGAVVRPVSPPVDHLQIGRIRDLSDHLEQTDLETGAVESLVLTSTSLRVSEPTFVVPFGQEGRVALMSPGRSTRHETIANWITAVLDFAPQGKSVRFRPVLDTSALEKLLKSPGLVALDFNVDADTEIPENGSLPLLDAVSEVQKVGPSTGTITFRWSLGLDGGSVKDQALIKRLALKVVEGSFVKSANANIIVQNEEGEVRREIHDLLEDDLVKKAAYHVESDKPTSTGVILSAIRGAIVDAGG